MRAAYSIAFVFLHAQKHQLLGPTNLIIEKRSSHQDEKVEQHSEEIITVHHKAPLWTAVWFERLGGRWAVRGARASSTDTWRRCRPPADRSGVEAVAHPSPDQPTAFLGWYCAPSGWVAVGLDQTRTSHTASRRTTTCPFVGRTCRCVATPAHTCHMQYTLLFFSIKV